MSARKRQVQGTRRGPQGAERAARCGACHEPAPDWRRPCPACGQPVPIAGRWVLEEVIGQGGSGTTWRGTEVATGATVAVKELNVRRAHSLKAIELFEREARALESLDHPGIPAFLADVTVEGPGSVSLYLVQELIDGETLPLGRGDEREVLTTVAELCDILVYLHERRPPVIHRDVKPSNVMRRQDGRLVLIDFGSVRHAIRDATLGGSTVAGTFGYMAPEQLRGLATPASDLYSVGALAVALLAGRDAAELVDPIRPTAWRREVTVSEPTARLLERLLEPDDTKRLADAAEVARAARALLDGGTPATPRTPARRRTRGRPRAPARPRRPPADLRAAERLIKRDLRRLRRADRWRGVSTGDTWLIPLMASPFAFWGGCGLVELTDHVGHPIGVGGIFALAAAALLAWLLVAARRRRWARTSHPWLHGQLRQGLLRLWPGRHDFEPRLRAALLGDPKREDYTGYTLGRAPEVWAEDPRLIPVLEARAYHLHLKGQHAEAASALEGALALGRAAFGEGHIAHLDQRARYATLRYPSIGHRDQALGERREAEAELAALEARESASHEVLLRRALDALAEEAGVPPADDPSAAARRVRAFKRRCRRQELLPGPGRWAQLAVLGFPLAMAGFLLGGVVAGVLADLGALGDPEEAGPGWFLLGGPVVAVAIPTLAGVLWPPRLFPRDWRDLYPDFDRTWPPSAPLRAQVLETFSRAWRDPYGLPGASSKAAQALIARCDPRVDFAELARDPRRMMDFMRGGGSRGRGPELTPTQTIQVEEVRTFVSWYDSAVLDNVARLKALPVDDAERRACLFEVQARRALKAGLDGVAAESLAHAEALRRGV